MKHLENDSERREFWLWTLEPEWLLEELLKLKRHAYVLGISQSRKRPLEKDIKLTVLQARDVSCQEVFCGPLLLALICITVQPWDPLPEPQAPSVSCCHHLEDSQHFWEHLASPGSGGGTTSLSAPC